MISNTKFLKRESVLKFTNIGWIDFLKENVHEEKIVF